MAFSDLLIIARQNLQILKLIMAQQNCALAFCQHIVQSALEAITFRKCSYNDIFRTQLFLSLCLVKFTFFLFGVAHVSLAYKSSFRTGLSTHNTNNVIPEANLCFSYSYSRGIFLVYSKLYVHLILLDSIASHF